MSFNYADALSDYPNKGICGLPEISDKQDEIMSKIQQLSEWMKSSRKTIFFVGAGISTVCGIPDFRGPSGVWTLEMKSKQTDLIKSENISGCVPEHLKCQTDTKCSNVLNPSDIAFHDNRDIKTETNNSTNLDFNQTKPSYTHFALTELVKHKLIHLIVSQNVDGLFLRTGLTRKYLCEMHGNFFLDECSYCLKRYVRPQSSVTIGLKSRNVTCPRKGRPCRGMLRDTILDWEDELPSLELNIVEKQSKIADLCVCLGTSLQIFPVADFPFFCKKNKPNSKNKSSDHEFKRGRVVIVNLQNTPVDSKADLVIHAKTDLVMEILMKQLDIQCPGYCPDNDLILKSANSLIEY